MTDDDPQDRTRWRPTREEFERYLEREVKMAKDNLASNVKPSDTQESLPK
jgi:hypothetical protein